MEKGEAMNAHAHHETPVYLDHAQPVDERVRDLLARMTLAEKISQMQHAAAAIPRLGIPAYNFWNEGLHGRQCRFGGSRGNRAVVPERPGSERTGAAPQIGWFPARAARAGRAPLTRVHDLARDAGRRRRGWSEPARAGAVSHHRRGLLARRAGAHSAHLSRWQPCSR